MAKAKTTWKWRNSTFSSKKELLAHLSRLAREAAQDKLGLHVDEVFGGDRQSHSVKFKIQVSLGAWPPRNRKSPPAAAGSAAPGKHRRLKPLNKAEVQKGFDEHF